MTQIPNPTFGMIETRNGFFSSPQILIVNFRIWASPRIIFFQILRTSYGAKIFATPKYSRFFPRMVLLSRAEVRNTEYDNSCDTESWDPSAATSLRCDDDEDGVFVFPGTINNTKYPLTLNKTKEFSPIMNQESN